MEEVKTETQTQEQTDGIGKLADALAKAQGEMEGASKDSKNPFFKSNYADLYSIWQACRLPLSKNGLAVIQTTNNDNGNVVIITTLAHSSGEWIRGSLEIKPMKQEPQALGSAITYGRRYALAAMVGVCPEDDDGEAATSRNSKGHKTKNTQPPSPPNNKKKPTAKEEILAVYAEGLKALAHYGIKEGEILKKLGTTKGKITMEDVVMMRGYFCQLEDGAAPALVFPPETPPEEGPPISGNEAWGFPEPVKKEGEISLYFKKCSDYKTEMGEDRYYGTMAHEGFAKANEAKTKKDRDRVLKALEEEKKNGGEKFIPCPNTGDPDDPATWDERKESYCNGQCDKRNGCPAFPEGDILK